MMINCSKIKKDLQKNQKGVTLILVAIMIPVTLAIFGLAIDMGVIYYYKLAYTDLAYTSTEVAMSKLSNLIVERAELNDYWDPEFCIEETEAIKCLYEKDRREFTENLDIRNLIKKTASENLQTNVYNLDGNKSKIKNNNITIFYPFNGSDDHNYKYYGEKYVKIRTEFTITVPVFFINFFKDQKDSYDIEIKGESKLPIK